MAKIKSKKRFSLNWANALPILLSLIGALISLLMTIFVARPLGAGLYGEVQYYIGIINVLSIVICFGLPSFLIKSAQFEEDKKLFFSKVLFVMDFLALFVFPFFFFLSFFVLNKLGQNPTLIAMLFLAAFAQSLSTIIASFLLGIRKASLSIIFENVLPKGILLVASIFLIFYGSSENFPELYVYLYLGIHIVCIVPFLVKFVRKTPIRFKKSEIITIATFFLISITYSINDSIAKVIQGEYSATFDTVGIFSLSTQIISFSTIFSGAITSISRPIFSNIAKKGDNNELIAFFKKILRVNSYIAIPFIIALCVEAKKALGLFGATYQAFPWILIIIGISSLYGTITGPCGTMLAMAGHERYELINGGVGMGIFLVLSFALVRQTIYGLPLAILFSVLVVNTLKLLEVFFIYKKPPLDLKTIFHLFILIAFSIIVFYPLQFIANTIVWLVVNSLVGGALIFMFFIINPNKEDRHFLLTIKNKKTDNA